MTENQKLMAVLVIATLGGNTGTALQALFGIPLVPVEAPPSDVAVPAAPQCLDLRICAEAN